MPSTPHVSGPRVARWPVAAKVMVTAFLLLVGAGYLVSVRNIFEHHQEADLSPGLTLDDLRRVYHGMDREVTTEVKPTTRSPMSRMVAPGGKMRKFLERGGTSAIRALITWLDEGAPEAGFNRADYPQAGDPSPQQVIRRRCIRCHNPDSDVPEIPYAPGFDTAPEYRLVAVKAVPPPAPVTQHTETMHLPPTGRPELVQITHVHMLSIPVFVLIVGGLFFATGLRPGVKALLGPLPMLALCFDFASWWLARDFEPFIYVIAVAGGVFGASYGLQILIVFCSMWFGRREGPTGT